MSTPTIDTDSVASRVMYELLGRRWVWPSMSTTEMHDVYTGQNVVILSGRPVLDVSSVHFEDSDTELGYTVENRSRLRLDKAVQHHLCSKPKRLLVVYNYGAEPPESVLVAISVLSSEIRKSIDHDEECRLPQRITNVSRQGVSMTIMDAQDFLEKGMTGVAEVDSVIALYNPTRARRRARVYGRLNPPPTRINTHVTETKT